jgi:hypothetical protein
MSKKITFLLFFAVAFLMATPIEAQTVIKKQAKSPIKAMKSGPLKMTNLKKVRAANIDALPYTNELNTKDLFEEFTVIDSNGDDITWRWGEFNFSVYISNGSVAADDWLISPAIKLEQGKLYHFAIDAKASASYYPEKFEVMIGQEASAAALTQSVISETTVTSDNFVTYEKEGIAVAETGYYYFGIHGISAPDMWNLTVSNFLVEVGAALTAPAAVTEFQASQVPDEKKVSISFKAPTTAINGDALTANIAKIDILRDGKVVKTLEDVAPGSEQTYVDELSTIGKYTYQVIPSDAEGPGQKSEIIEIMVVASLDVPSTLDLTQNMMDLFQIIDNNNDASTWNWNSYMGTYYSSSYSNAADDYLVLLPFNLKAGKNYNVILVANASSSFNPEKFEVKIGKEATVDGLNQIVIPETVVTNAEPMEFERSFSVTEDGKYYVAIHALSDANMFNLVVKSLTLEAGAEPTSPAAISDFTALPGEKGALEVNLTFTTPSQAVDGSALTGTVDVNIYRDNQLVSTLSGVVPGAAQTWKDTEVEDGKTYIYHLVASNEAGNGMKSEKISVYVGQDEMADVTNLQVKSTTANTMTFTWDKVTGKNNGYINTDNVQYAILSVTIQSTPWGDYFVEGDVLGTVTGETTGTFDYSVDEGEQGYRYFAVKAINGEKTTNVSIDSYTFWLVGQPYDLPMLESFTGGNLNYDTWETAGSNNTKGMLVSDSSDGDDYGLFITTIEEPGFVMLKSGKIDLTNAVNPTLLFDTKGWGITEAIVLGSVDDGEWTEIQSIALTEDYAQAKVPLTNAKGTRFTRFAIGANIINNSEIAGFDESTWQYVYDWKDLLFIDNIKVVDLLSDDLSISVTAQETVTAGQKATINATIENKGENAANGFNVKITAGDLEIFNKTVNASLPSFAETTLTAQLSTSIFDNAGDLPIKAEVFFEKDKNETNNVAETVISIKEPAVAGPENVTAHQNANEGVDLAWQAPAGGQVTEVTEDFSSYENGANDTGLLGDWTLVNNNGATKGAIFQGFTLANDGKVKAWELIKPSEYGIDLPEFKGPKGSFKDAYLLSTYNIDAATQGYPDNDDWLISPKLLGIAHTITFSITAFDDYLGQNAAATYEVLASTTDKEIASFTKVAEGSISKFGWQTVQASLPEGTNYFAIRNTTNGDVALGMFLGNITYLGGIAEVTAYNIYYDGSLIATVEGDQTTYVVDSDKLASGECTFAISAVYSNGQESKPVSVTIDVVVGIQQVMAEGKAVDIYSLDGKLVRSQATTLKGLRGVYVINGKTVMIKE